MQRFNWSHICSLEKKDHRCRDLVDLSIHVRFSPDKSAGRMKIYKWLDKIRATGYYYVCVRDVEEEFLNRIGKIISWD